MRKPLLILVAAIGCSGREEPVVSVEPAPPAPASIDPIVKGVPHGGSVTEVAVTESADAALTFDNIGGVRLWPALDGSRTPVPLSLVALEQLALAHAGRDLLAGVLDEAGAVDLLRLGRDGSVRGRVQLPGDVAYEQVVALGDGMLVRGADQSVEWLSADGESRGKVFAEPARRIQTIAARRGVAVAVTSDGTKHRLRWLLALGGKLTWGASRELPVTVRGDDIALSPSHSRIAIIDPASNLSVFEIGLVPTRIGTTRSTSGADIDLGFIADDRVALLGAGSSQVQWWTAPANPREVADPWAVDGFVLPRLPAAQLTNSGAVADGLAVAGIGSSLALLDHDNARYLGYKEHAAGKLGAASSSLWFADASHVVWLDDRLALERAIELREDPHGPWTHATPVGERHVVTHAYVNSRYALELVDVDKPAQRVSLGSYSRVDRVEFTPGANLLGVAVDRKLHRFKLDLATSSFTSLPALATRSTPSSFRLLDPARADGIVAIALGWDREHDESPTLTMYREDGTKKRIQRFSGTLIDIAADGTTYTHDGGRIVIRRGEEMVASFAVKGGTAPMAVSRDGTRFAVRDRNDIVVLDRTGREMWRKSLWGAAQLVFTADGEHLAVHATGGVVLLAAQTGEREAMECGWSFGLTDTPPAANTMAAAPLCEDPML